jgi:hypothetical protein
VTIDYSSSATSGTLNVTANGHCSSSPTRQLPITVNGIPRITTDPTSPPAFCAPGNTSFTVAASGAGLTYAWQEYNGSSWTTLTNTGIYSNVTTATMNINGATVSMNNYQYRCVVSGTCSPPVTSNTATLTIYLTPNSGPIYRIPNM